MNIFIHKSDLNILVSVGSLPHVTWKSLFLTTDLSLIFNRHKLVLNSITDRVNLVFNLNSVFKFELFNDNSNNEDINIGNSD